MKKIISRSEIETKNLAKELGKNLKGGSVIGLLGDLGEGKTTFVQGLAEGLGIEGRIISPTFIVIRSYNLKNKLTFYHIDLYRVGKEDLENLGIFEIMDDERAIVAIEWADKMGEYFPEKGRLIKFETLSEDSREITFYE